MSKKQLLYNRTISIQRGLRYEKTINLWASDTQPAKSITYYSEMLVPWATIVPIGEQITSFVYSIF